ncbi:MAG TPA: hypothetical protein VG944_12880 [Fimbriimonas sp.]|nr:hypothetical protein [Fimbriimonas sp.]
MDHSVETESVSLWGVLHEGTLTRIFSDQPRQCVLLEAVVPHLNGYYDWPEGAPIRFELSEVSELKVNQWLPELGEAKEDLGARRGSRRQWQAQERSMPPNYVVISEATVTRSRGRVGVSINGFEHTAAGETNVLLEIAVSGSELKVETPDGPTDVEKLIHIGDAYWDNFDKKRKK